MPMNTRILSKAEEPLWLKFVENHPQGTLNQTPQWAHFQEKLQIRGKYWIIVVEENHKIIGGSLIIRHKLPKKLCWFYSSRGPLVDYRSPRKAKAQIAAIKNGLKALAKKKNAIFYRIDPPISKSQKIPHFYQNCPGFQPEHTLLIDLTKSEKEILAQMKQKGRYNIRLAEKKGVTIHKSNIHHLSEFYKLLLETTLRDKFSPHGQDFYQTMLESLPKNAELYFAQYQGRTLAGLIKTTFKDTATYYYGASSNSDRNLMAPYLLQWQVIKDCKAAGFKTYDFLGIAPEGIRSHPWAGVTSFKTKFGGQRKNYAKAQETPFKKLLYWLYKIYKFVL